MNQDGFTYAQILFAGLAALGGLAGIFKGLEFIAKQLDKRKSARQKRIEQHLSQSAEMQRIVAEAEHIDDEAVKSALWRMLEEKKTEIDAFKATIRELEHAESLSRPIRVKIYGALRAIRKQIDILDLLILRQTEHRQLSDEMEILRQRLDELERSVP